MPKPCSLDLRMRVLREVEAGASRREAAECVEVSASSAIKWMQRLNETGSIAAKPSGGSISPLEAHAAVLLGLIAEQPDLTLDEIVAVDAQAPDRRQPQRGLAVLQAAQCQLQKKACAQRSSSEPMWSAPGGAGCENKACLTRPDWCLLMRPQPTPPWCGFAAAARAAFG